MSESCCTRSHLSWGRRRDVGNLIAMPCQSTLLADCVCVISIPLLFPRFNSSFLNKKSSIVLLLLAAYCNVDLMICHNDECAQSDWRIYYQQQQNMYGENHVLTCLWCQMLL